MENNAKSTDLLTLKRNSLMMGLCEKYRHKWDSCTTKRQLIDLALDSNGVEFMADSIAFGWGLGKDYLVKVFADFINGAYVRDKDGYTSEFYVGARGVIELRSTLLLVAYCDGLEIKIPKGSAGRVYVCGGSKIRIENDGYVDIQEYGSVNNIDIIAHNGSNSSHKRVLSSEWATDRHDGK